MLAITSNWRNNYAPKCDRKENPRVWEPKDNVRCALSQTYACIDKLLNNKLYQNFHWIWFNDYLHTFVKVHTHYTCSFIYIGEVLRRPTAWILLTELLSCLSFASWATTASNLTLRYFAFISCIQWPWTSENYSVDPWGSMDPRLGTTGVGKLKPHKPQTTSELG